jgi:hypothetical protein
LERNSISERSPGVQRTRRALVEQTGPPSGGKYQSWA